MHTNDLDIYYDIEHLIVETGETVEEIGGRRWLEFPSTVLHVSTL